jgi:hypothetical protein
VIDESTDFSSSKNFQQGQVVLYAYFNVKFYCIITRKESVLEAFIQRLDGLRSSGMLRSVDWYLVADVSGQLIGPKFKGQAVSTNESCLRSQKSKDLIYTAAEA